jgi:hypothetical protein
LAFTHLPSAAGLSSPPAREDPSLANKWPEAVIGLTRDWLAVVA